MVIITRVIVLAGTYTIIKSTFFLFFFNLSIYSIYNIIMLKIGLTEREIHEKCETKELTRVNSDNTYINLQVWNEDI